MTVTVQDVSAALQAIVDPNTGKDLVAGKSARNIRVDGADVAVDVELGYPARSQVDPIRRQVVAALRGLPLDIRIRQQADSGKPTVVADPDGDLAGRYREIARKVAVKIAEKARDMSLKFPSIVVQNT